MNELKAIVEAYEMNRRQGKRAALASLVYASGSTYRRAGARMLINEDGHTTGSISGGCLEADVIERALQVLISGTPVLATYDTRAPEDLVWGLGLGCQGVVEVLIESLAHETALKPFDLLIRAQAARQTCVCATVTGVAASAPYSALSDRLLLTAAGVTANQIRHPALARQVREDAARALALGRSELKSYGAPAAAVKVYLEIIEPPVPLVLFGAGPDALPVMRCARELGWHVTIVDTRMRAATQARFHEADEIILCRAGEIETRVTLDARTVAVLMSHNYLDDLELLKRLLPAPPRYLGLLGPRKRGQRLLDELAACHGITLSVNDQRLHSPIGLDIGADTPAEIALSIIAEIRAVLAGRPASFLKERHAPIHAAVDELNQPSEARWQAGKPDLKLASAQVACALA